MKEKPDVGPPYFGVFPSDHILMMRDVNVHFFPHAVVPVNFTSEFPETFLSCYIYVTKYTPEADVVIIPY
jgi:hypothetical protein